jgi:subtilisin family serine protease
VLVDGSRRIKPEIVAPGAEILSAYPGGTYEFADGTSMAGPHVAGVVALVWSSNPKLIGEIDATRKILIETANPYTDVMNLPCTPGKSTPSNEAGYGIINAYEAVKRARQWQAEETP